MGVGKGTIARAFNKKYDIFILDTDDLIESMENKSVKKIFREEGEEYFRNLEQKTANWIEKSVNSSLISCGGGFYKVNNIDKLGKVILLDASFEWIYNRLKNAPNSKNKLAKRPLFSKIDEAKKLYSLRKEEYKRVADYVVDIENRAVDEVLEFIYSIHRGLQEKNGL